MNNSKKIWYLSVVFVFIVAGGTIVGSAQDRERVVRTISSKPLNQPPAPNPSKPTNTKQTTVESRPINRPPLLQNISVTPKESESLVKKIVSSSAVNGMTAIAADRMVYDRKTTGLMQKAIFARLGIRYLYGATGPNRYDCSGFVWAVFADAGLDFTRTSARSLWSMSEPVFGDDRFKFGTLVFLNGLGHMGIVADENGFYHASSSKGITYSPFAGYWSNRIVGFRRLNLGGPAAVPAPSDSK